MALTMANASTSYFLANNLADSNTINQDDLGDIFNDGVAGRAQKRRRTSSHASTDSASLKRAKLSIDPALFTLTTPIVAEDNKERNSIATDTLSQSKLSDSAEIPHAPFKSTNIPTASPLKIVDEGPTRFTFLQDTNAIPQDRSIDTGECTTEVQDRALAEAREAMDRLGTGPKGNEIRSEAPTLEMSRCAFAKDPIKFLKVRSLPALEALADQVIDCFSADSMQFLDPVSVSGRAWFSLEKTFVQVHALVSPSTRYIEPGSILFSDADFGEIALKANIAHAFISLLQPSERACQEIHDHFFDIFAPQKCKVREWQGDMLHDVKIQLYLASLKLGARSSSDLREDFFPIDLETRLRPNMADDEYSTKAITNLLRKCNDTRAYLDNDEPEIAALESKYSFAKYSESLVKTFVVHVSEIRAVITATSSLAVPKTLNSDKHPEHEPRDSVESEQLDYEEDSPPLDSDDYEEEDDDDDEYDQETMIQEAAKAAHAALTDAPSLIHSNGQSASSNYVRGPTFSTFSSFSQQPTASFPAHHGTLAHSSLSFTRSLAAQAALARSAQPSISTQEQYEKARLVAMSKAVAKSSAKGNANTGSHRRPWDSKEEKALMNGLDHVKGPHWSQILAMYGIGGTISDVLKNRNQVQLKDKARNLKLFFLKSGLDVPPALEHVTGELKTRVPAREAKKKAKKQSHDPTSEDIAGNSSNGPSGHDEEDQVSGDEANSAPEVKAGRAHAKEGHEKARDLRKADMQREERLPRHELLPDQVQMVANPDAAMESALLNALKGPSLY